MKIRQGNAVRTSILYGRFVYKWHQCFAPVAKARIRAESRVMRRVADRRRFFARIRERFRSTLSCQVAKYFARKNGCTNRHHHGDREQCFVSLARASLATDHACIHNQSIFLIIDRSTELMKEAFIRASCVPQTVRPAHRHANNSTLFLVLHGFSKRTSTLNNLNWMRAYLVLYRTLLFFVKWIPASRGTEHYDLWNKKKAREENGDGRARICMRGKSIDIVLK